MAQDWTQEEWENKRRLVYFRKQQTGSILTVTFKPVSVAEQQPQSICISCIWWEEKQACYVTSADTIHLLEQLLAGTNQFGVDEKHRIRRNLERFSPTTVSKARGKSEEFFKVIMDFRNPKPRNIEKDIKVFHWKDMAGALHNIISKYSASTATVMAPTIWPPHVVFTVGLSGSYPAAPDPAAAASYGGPASYHHMDSLTSSRALAEGPSWPTAYNTAPKTIHPSTLPVVYNHRGTTHSLAAPCGLSRGHSHHPHSTHPGHGGADSHCSGVPVSRGQWGSWEGDSIAEGYHPG